MNHVTKIMDFAEKIYLEDQEKMKRLEAWEAYIQPKFKKRYANDYRAEYEGMYSKPMQKFIDEHRAEFENLN